MHPETLAVIQREALWTATSTLRTLRSNLTGQINEVNKSINLLDRQLGAVQRQIDRAEALDSVNKEEGSDGTG